MRDVPRLGVSYNGLSLLENQVHVVCGQGLAFKNCDNGA